MLIIYCKSIINTKPKTNTVSCSSNPYLLKINRINSYLKNTSTKDEEEKKSSNSKTL